MKTKYLLVFFITLIYAGTVLISCSTDSASDNQRTVCWKVVDHETSEPIEGARIIIYQEVLTLSRVTDENGRACYTWGSYSVQSIKFTAEGYVPQTYEHLNIPETVRLRPVVE